MALVSGGGASRLNPDAPLFVPAAYRQVEDYSPEWWQLVTTTSWFQEYWLSTHQEDAEDDYHSDVADLLPDSFDLEDFSGMELQFDELAYEAQIADAS